MDRTARPRFILISCFALSILSGCGNETGSPAGKTEKIVLTADSSGGIQNTDNENTGSEQELDESDPSSGIFEKYDRAAKLLKDWNAAINANTPEQLNEIYADQVEYYLQAQTKKACVNQKSGWLSKHPGFSQEITDLEIYFLDTDTNASVLMAEFTKLCKDQGKTTRVPALIYFEMSDGAWKITKETDLATEVVRAKKTGASTLKKGDYSFWRGYWKDTRSVYQFAHDMVPFWFSVDLTVGDRIEGEYLTYSGEMRSIAYSFIPEGVIKNGILDLTVVDCSSLIENITMEEYKSGEYDHLPKKHLHFKVIGGNVLVNLDKDEPIYGKPLMIKVK